MSGGEDRPRWWVIPLGVVGLLGGTVAIFAVVRALRVAWWGL